MHNFTGIASGPFELWRYGSQISSDVRARAVDGQPLLRSRLFQKIIDAVVFGLILSSCHLLGRRPLRELVEDWVQRRVDEPAMEVHAHAT